jgi:hypothetical protein
MNKEVDDNEAASRVCDPGPLLVALALAPTALAQQSGGTLKIGNFDSPASMSMLEATNRPMLGVFNNLVIFRQNEPQNTLKSFGLANLAYNFTRLAWFTGRTAPT